MHRRQHTARAECGPWILSPGTVRPGAGVWRAAPRIGGVGVVWGRCDPHGPDTPDTLMFKLGSRSGLDSGSDPSAGSASTAVCRDSPPALADRCGSGRWS